MPIHATTTGTHKASLLLSLLLALPACGKEPSADAASASKEAAREPAVAPEPDAAVKRPGSKLRPVRADVPLPEANHAWPAEDGLLDIKISTRGLSVGDEKLLLIDNGEIKLQDMKGPHMVPALYERLKAHVDGGGAALQHSYDPGTKASTLGNVMYAAARAAYKGPHRVMVKVGEEEGALPMHVPSFDRALSDADAACRLELTLDIIGHTLSTIDDRDEAAPVPRVPDGSGRQTFDWAAFDARVAELAKAHEGATWVTIKVGPGVPMRELVRALDGLMGPSCDDPVSGEGCWFTYFEFDFL